MFEPNEYQLLDFGSGRKLERFGSEILDRPSPAAERASASNPDLWDSATGRFEVVKGSQGRWTGSAASANSDNRWAVRHGDSRLIMQLGASGNVGVFPEQASNWDWIADQVRQVRDSRATRPPRVLNLFAYTGGASLAAAAAGAEVTHVDSSGPTVAWAKRNAEVSGLADRPVRWLVEDATKFVARECRRGNTYDGVILDPPTYGHGPKRKPFKFAEHVGELLDLCAELIVGEHAVSRFLVFSCHTPGVGPEEAASMVSTALPDSEGGQMTSRPLALASADGRKLSAGVSVRWSAGS